MDGRAYLGGGGSEQDEANLWDAAFASGAHVVVWPVAHPAAADREATGCWIVGALRRRGSFTVDVWMERAGRTALDLDGVDVIAIPGGNTFDLAHVLRADGLFTLLSSFLERGGGVYGGSAGAVLMGADIGIASIADSNDVGLRETCGLDLVGGLDVLPHYTRGHHGVARAHHRHSGRGVLCLPEPSGVVIAGGKARNVGPAAVHVVTSSSSVTYGPGDSWNAIQRWAVR